MHAYFLFQDRESYILGWLQILYEAAETNLFTVLYIQVLGLQMYAPTHGRVYIVYTFIVLKTLTQGFMHALLAELHPLPR